MIAVNLYKLNTIVYNIHSNKRNLLSKVIIIYSHCFNVLENVYKLLTFLKYANN